jgi:hypothetical protein
LKKSAQEVKDTFLIWDQKALADAAKAAGVSFALEFGGSLDGLNLVNYEEIIK